MYPRTGVAQEVVGVYQDQNDEGNQQSGCCIDKDQVIKGLLAENARLKQENMRLAAEVDESNRSAQMMDLRRSEQKFSKAFYHNQAAMSITRLRDNKLMNVNQKYIEVTGYSRKEIIGKSALLLWANLPDRERMLQDLARKGYVNNIQFEHRKKSGEITTLAMAASIIEFEGEKYMLASAIDVTEQRKAEEALGLSRKLLLTVFDANPLPMLVMSIENGTVLAVNQSFVNAGDYGHTREGLRGRNVHELEFWADIEELIQFIYIVKRDGLARNFEVSFRLRSGEIINELLSGVTINWQGEEAILTVCNDITELRRYKQEVARLDRLNLIGGISTSIAHEIRNPLTTVNGFLQLFKGKDRYAEDTEFIDLMLAEVHRANAIITEFLSLANDKAVTLRKQNLNERIQGLLPVLLAKTKKHDIKLRLLMGDIPDTLLDTDEFRQMVLNLALNGIEAMPSGGCLTIKTYNVGEGAALAIEDQGCGMTEEVLKKLGTPFFTTKEYGTGLGLPVCYSIAHRHHASIEIATGSEGTTFIVSFPPIQ